MLGGVVLCLTGSEALFADMGHFGRMPIAAAWFSAVFPALVLQYTGQSAYLLRHLADLSPDPADMRCSWSATSLGGACDAAVSSDACCARFTAAQAMIANSFWHAQRAPKRPTRPAERGPETAALAAAVVPPLTAPPCDAGSPCLECRRTMQRSRLAPWPLLLAASLSSQVRPKPPIAQSRTRPQPPSRAAPHRPRTRRTAPARRCAGVFTIFAQAAGLGLFPAMKVVQTSSTQEHQVFCPSINAVMCVTVLVIVGAFQHSSNLTAVFGACVGCAFLCDSLLRLGVAAFVQRWRWPALCAVGLPLLVMDGALASANVAKYFEAAPLLLGGGTLLGPGTWVAFIPLIIFVLLTAAMAVWLWGRRIQTVEGAKATSLLLLAGGQELSRGDIAGMMAAADDAAAAAEHLHLEIEAATPRAGQPAPQPGALADARRVTSFLTDDSAASDGDGGAHAHGPAQQAVLARTKAKLSVRGSAGDGLSVLGDGRAQPLARKPSSFLLSDGPRAARREYELRAFGDDAAYTELAAALLRLQVSGRLRRPMGGSLFLLGQGSFLDSEPLSAEESAAADGGALGAAEDGGLSRQEAGRPLELPPAFLRCVERLHALPALSIVLSVHFTSGQPFVPPSQRVGVRPVRRGGCGGGAAAGSESGTRSGLPAFGSGEDLKGVYVVTIRYGWAERPKTSHEVVSLLTALGRGAVADGRPDLSVLQHLGCRHAAGGVRSGAQCRAGGYHTGRCLPVNFVIGADELTPSAAARAPARAACSLFNSLATLTSPEAFLQLPRRSVVMLSGFTATAGIEGADEAAGGDDGSSTWSIAEAL